ncbi:MAG: endopeptidase La [Thermodesulfobacteriota bacterium]
MKLFGRTEETKPEDVELESLREAVNAAQLPAHVEQAARQELERLEKTHPSTAEYAIGLNYLDYLVTLPWKTRSEDNLDIKHAEEMLNQVHFGLAQVKDRILEYLAVRILKIKKKPRLLVADDEEITRNNLSFLFQKEGYLVTAAADGVEAMACLEKSDFDVVVTDMKMGRVDGLVVLEKARKKNPETQVVVITAYATVDSAVEVMKKGAFHYLSKPFKLDDLRRLVKQILEQKGRFGVIRGPVLCFAGPPGTGKTSLGWSIAQALGRKFLRLSLAGMKDEAELRGHRKTYAGAMPGRIIQEIKRVGVNNPVFLLDEVDKAIQNISGNPTAALLEVLDPEQNQAFVDYYLNLPFDLSNVLFIATANLMDPIPPALRDRMEVLPLTGYTDSEKVQIALRHIVPRQIKENGLEDHAPAFNAEAVLKIVHEYTREAGLRNLEREIARVCRKLAREVLTENPGQAAIPITPDRIEHYLGPRRHYRESAETVDRIGVATGMVWSENGGDLVFIEATIMRGRSNLILTGSLGEVMQESAQAALSYIRAHTDQFGLDREFFENQDIHVHVPAGAIPKDGPSAGLTIAVALLSLLLRRPARRDVALTGELTLSGRLLPVGGIREKVLAAKRAGVAVVVFPEKNRPDFSELPLEAYEGLRVVLVNSLEEILEIALLSSPHPPRSDD